MKARLIRPSIAVNEDLAALGPMAEILFTRLWMLADREGRLEDRPRRIKNAGLPNYDVSEKDVEDLLEKLSISGFILRYSATIPTAHTAHNGAQGERKANVIQVVNFAKHQYIHKSEPASTLPAPPRTEPPSSPRRKRTSEPKQAKKQPRKEGLSAVVNNSQTSPEASGDPHGNSAPSYSYSYYSEYSTVTDRSREREAEERSVGPAERPPRKPPKTETDFWPHDSEKVQVFRGTLASLGKFYGLPEPDDAMVRQVLDLCPDMTGPQFFAMVRELEQSHRFRGMRSYGLVPDVLRRHRQPREQTG